MATTEIETAVATASGSGSASQSTKRVVKRKPARKQVEAGQIEKKAPEQTGQTYNIWYNKWAGGDKYDEYNAKSKSQSKVNLSLDSGYTRADGGVCNYCCIFFARGCCPKGKDCEFLHRLPLPAHKLPDSSMDCFGRPKHGDYRDDMGGVGSFNRQNRTLYVGRIKETRDVEHVIERHFEEYGEIEKLRVLRGRSVAFVTFRNEHGAQFAKEAMMHQSLDNDEILNVRWASEDPNPTAKVAEAKRLVDVGEAGIAAKITPAFVRQVREMDELEGLVQPLPEDDQADEDQVIQSLAVSAVAAQSEERPAKKLKVIEESSSASTATLNPSSLLSNNALEGLKYVAALRTQQQQEPPARASESGLAGLGGYGSDSD